MLSIDHSIAVVTYLLESEWLLTMINISKIMAGLTLKGWVFVGVGIIIWAAVTYGMGSVSEKKWGDRESGALIGFCIPGALITLLLYLL